MKREQESIASRVCPLHAFGEDSIPGNLDNSSVVILSAEPGVIPKKAN